MKSAHGGWISRGPGKGKDRDQNIETGKVEGSTVGRAGGRKGMANTAGDIFTY